MFDKLVSLLTGERSESASAGNDLQLSVAALLVEAAGMDSIFDDRERDTIRDLLAARFNLSPAATENLLNAATQAAEKSVQIFGFTRGMAERLSYEDRVQIIEMLWSVAYADGVLTAEEDSLIRRVAGLIYVTDSDRAAARRRALSAKDAAAS